MSNIEINVIALGNFAELEAQLKALQAQVTKTNAALTSVGAAPRTAKQLQELGNAFHKTMMESGLFTSKVVSLGTAAQNLGDRLSRHKTVMSDYRTALQKVGNQASIYNQLAQRQVALEQAKIMSVGGVTRVYAAHSVEMTTAATRSRVLTQEIIAQNTALKQAATNVVNFGKNTQWAGRQLTAGLTMPMMMFGAAAAKVFFDFNKEIARLNKVYGVGVKMATDQELAAISKQTTDLALKLSRTTGIAAKETASLAADFATAGLQGNQLLSSTEQAARIMVLGEIDKQEAVKATIAIQNAYKLTTKQQMADAMNFFVATQDATSVTLQDLVEAVPRVGGVVRTLGGTYKDMVAMIVAMKEGGVSAPEAANAIKNSLARIINPTEKARAVLQGMGIDLKDIVERNAGDLNGTMTELQQGLDKLSSLNRQRAIAELFGKFQFARMTALMDNWNKTGSQSAKVFEMMGLSSEQLANTTDKQMSRLTGSVSRKFTSAMEQTKNALLPIGEEMLKIFTVILDSLTGLFNAINNLPGPLKTGLGAILGIAVLAGPIIMITGLLGNLAGQFMKFGANIRTIFQTLTTSGVSLRETLGKKFALWTEEQIAASKASSVFSHKQIEQKKQIDVVTEAIFKQIAALEKLAAEYSAATVSSTAMNAGQTTALSAALGGTAIINGNRLTREQVQLSATGKLRKAGGSTSWEKQLPYNSVITRMTVGGRDKNTFDVMNNKLKGTFGGVMLSPVSYSSLLAKDNFAFSRVENEQYRAEMQALIKSIRKNEVEWNLVGVENSELAQILDVMIPTARKAIEMEERKLVYTEMYNQSLQELAATGKKNEFLLAVEGRNHTLVDKMVKEKIAAESQYTKIIQDSSLSHEQLKNEYNGLIRKQAIALASSMESVRFNSAKFSAALRQLSATTQVEVLGATTVSAATGKGSNAGAHIWATAEANNTMVQAMTLYTDALFAAASGAMTSKDAMLRFAEEMGLLKTRLAEEERLLKARASATYASIVQPNVSSLSRGARKNIYAAMTNLSMEQLESVKSSEIVAGKLRLLDAEGKLVAAIETRTIQEIEAGEQARLKTIAEITGTAASEKHKIASEVLARALTEGTIDMDAGVPVQKGLNSLRGRLAAKIEQIIPVEEENRVVGYELIGAKERVIARLNAEGAVIPTGGNPKTRIGTGVMMGSMAASMAGGMMMGSENQAVATAGNSLMYGGMAASMAAMIPGIGTAVAVGIGAVTAMIPIVTKAFEVMNHNSEVAAARMVGDFSVSSIAAEQFGLKLRNISEVEMKHLVGASAQAADAVKQMAEAYASDQADEATKNYIEGIRNLESSGEVVSAMLSKYRTDILAGLDPAQAKQDIAAILKAAGKETYTMDVQLKIDKIGLQTPVDTLYSQIDNILKNSPDKEKGTTDAMRGYIVDYKNSIRGIREVGLSVSEVDKILANSDIKNFKSGTFDKNLTDAQNKAIAEYSRASSGELTGTIIGSLFAPESMTKIGISLSNAFQAMGVDEFIATLDELPRTLLWSGEVFDGFISQIEKSNPEFAKILTSLQEQGASFRGVTVAAQLYMDGTITSIEELRKAAKDPVVLDYYIREHQIQVGNTEAMSSAERLNSELSTSTASTAASASTSGDGLEGKYQARIDAIKAEQELRQKNIELQKKELDMAQQKLGLENQLRDALASGNLLKAAELRQQMAVNESTQQAEDENQKLKDSEDKRIALLEKKIEKLKQASSAAGNAEKTAPAYTVESLGAGLKDLFQKNPKMTAASLFDNKDVKQYLQSYMNLGVSQKDAKDAISRIFYSNRAGIIGLTGEMYGKSGESLVESYGAKYQGLTDEAKQGIQDMIEQIAIGEGDADTKTGKIKDYLEKRLGGGAKAAADAAESLRKVYEKPMNASGYADAAVSALSGISSAADQAIILQEAIRLMAETPTLSAQEAIKQARSNTSAARIAASGADADTQRWMALGESYLSRANGGIISYGNGSIGAVFGPGGPKDDLIPAMLSNGEYVVQAAAVAKYGIPFFDQVNAMKFSAGGMTPVAHYAGGGNVGAVNNTFYISGGDPSKIADEVMNKINVTMKKQGAVISI